MQPRPPQIIAMGGGGFSMEPENLALDRYVLGATARETPKVCFLPTASGDAEGYIERFYLAFRTLRSVPTHLALSSPDLPDLLSFILAQDVIYVGGGNTPLMLETWRRHGLDGILREAWERGILLAGLSAGSHCWFESGLTDAIPGTLTPVECLGFLQGSNCVHYDGEIERRPAYHAAVADGTLPEGLAADDGIALHFLGTRLHKVISSRKAARAYSVNRVEGVAVEREIVPEYLLEPES